MKLDDKDYWQVGDKVYSFHSMQVGTVKTIGLFKGYPIRMVTDNNDYGCFDFDTQGRYRYDQKPTLFHLNAITFDTQGRPVSIDYDYVPDRTPKVKVTKLPHEFEKGECVLVKNGNNTWKRATYRTFFPFDSALFAPYFWIQQDNINYKMCIPYEGNEHCEGKLTNCESGKIPDDYVFPKPKHEFKPFDRVLVKKLNWKWKLAFFSHEKSHKVYPEFKYYIIGNTYEVYTDCVPYEGNERLLGTTDSPEE